MNTTDVLIYIDIFMDVLLIAFFIWTVNRIERSTSLKISKKDVQEAVNNITVRRPMNN
jgi:hypothetical protein